MTIREQIIQAIVTKLNGTTQVGTNIFRSRKEAIEAPELPALLIEPINDIPSAGALPRAIWELTFHVTAIIKADSPDTAIDPIIQDVYQRVMADQDLGGLTMDLMPATSSYQFVEGDMPRLIFAMQFKATYQSNLKDLSTV